MCLWSWILFSTFVLTSIYFSYFYSPLVFPYLCIRVRRIICISVDAGQKPLLVPWPLRLSPIIVVQSSLVNLHVFVCLHICLNICRVKVYLLSLVERFLTTDVYQCILFLYCTCKNQNAMEQMFTYHTFRANDQKPQPPSHSIITSTLCIECLSTRSFWENVNSVWHSISV